MTESNTDPAEKDHTRVAPTANGVAYLRTFSDIPLTKEIYEALERQLKTNGHSDVESSMKRDQLAPQLEARYKLVDRLLLSAGVSQVIELAAGIAPRGINLAQSRPEFKYVEIDLPSVVKEKESLISQIGITLPPNLRLVSGDALSTNDIQHATDGFEADKSVAVVNEGLMRYLTFDEKAVLAQNVRRVLEQFGGVWITPDISLKQALSREDEAAGGHINNLTQITGIDISQNVFDDEAHALDFFESQGFKAESHSFLEVSDQLVSPERLDMTSEDVTRLNGPCIAFMMTLSSTTAR